MQQGFFLQRTTTSNPHFQLLVQQLDHELFNELKEDQATYDPFNKVPDIKTAVLIYKNNEPVACGCFKAWDKETVEVKRMFVQKNFRGLGLSKTVLHELELWAMESGYRFAVLETSIYFTTARRLYQSCGYSVIPNYPPYTDLHESVCMKKELQKQTAGHKPANEIQKT